MPDGVTPIGPTLSTPPETKSEPDSCRVCSMTSRAWLGSMSSASTKARNSPVACSMPRLREKPGPPFGILIRMNLGSDSARRRAMSALPSVEPSSTMTTSRLACVCLAMDRRQSSSKSSLL